MTSESQGGQMTVGIFDAGIGGIPLAARIRQAAPQYRIVYMGDAARRPYGPQDNATVARYVGEAEAFFYEAGCDVWVIACNTASVVADRALAGQMPCIDMVSAVLADLPPPTQGPVGVLGTAGTVASGVYPNALRGYQVHQVAAEELLRLAEEGGGDDPRRVLELAHDAMREMLEKSCTTTVLACTDFTCIIDEMRAAAGDSKLLDPLDSAAVLTIQTLQDLEAKNGWAAGATTPRLPDRLCMTAPHPVDAVKFAKEEFGLELPPVEIVSIGSTDTHN
jgi:glutamate racemase